MPLFRGTRLPLILGGRRYIDKVLSHGPIALWPMNEPSGTVAHCLVNPAQNGAYTGVTLGQPGAGDGNTSPLFDGANDYVNIYSTTFRDAFNGAEGTALIWAKVYNAAVWEEDLYRKPLSFWVDGENYVAIDKWTTDNTLTFRYRAGDVTETITISSISLTTWMCLGITWSKSADEVRGYLNGVQQGATETGLGTWAGTLLSTGIILGARTTSLQEPWYGWLALGAVWTRALAPAAMLDLATL